MKSRILLILTALLMASAAAIAVEPPVRVSVLGDSYSTFEGAVMPDTNEVWYFNKMKPRLSDVTKVEQTWWRRFVDSGNYVLERNNSYSGSTIDFLGYKDRSGKNADYTSRSFITRADNLGNPELLLVFGATNDSWIKGPVGDYVYSDWTRSQLFTFRPAMACLLDKLTRLYPDARIVFMLNCGLRPEINESVETICRRYSVELLKLQSIDKRAGHPTILGMKQIARQLADFLAASDR